jgi:hypothetical protein
MFLIVIGVCRNTLVKNELKRYLYKYDALWRKYISFKDVEYSTVLQKKALKKCLYCFGTGGTAQNFPVKKIIQEDILVVSRGFIKFYTHFGILPKFWYLHNLDSVMMVLQEDHELIKKLDFSNCYIIMPSIMSYSTKRFRLFSKGFELILNNFKGIRFLTYNENMRYLKFEDIEKKYLKDKSFIRYPDGSAVDTVFIPLAHAMKYQEVVFSGVDHSQTGHFWDLNEPYRGIRGEILEFEARQSISSVRKYAVQCCTVANRLGFTIRQFGNKRSKLFGLYDEYD